MTDQTQTIAAQNDAFRKDGPSARLQGLLVMTAGVAALPASLQILVLAKMQAFDAFSEDNDPYGEHDFGSIDTAAAGKVFWKIDCFADAQMEFGSESPADPAQTFRVLTIMLAADY